MIYVTHDIAEALLMADRILVMGERPGAIAQEIPVTFDRPRSIADLYGEQGLSIQHMIWQQLEKSVRHSLAVAETS